MATVAIIGIGANQSEAAMAELGSLVYLHAEPGSWVGGGIGSEEVLWEHGYDGIFFVDKGTDYGITVSYNDGDHWFFRFAAPTYDITSNTNDGQSLEVGLYDNATRLPFNSPTEPGLNFSGNGRGNNELGGWFNVLDVAYGDDGDLMRLAIDFRQYDDSEEMFGPSTYGSLRINSDVPYNPVPIQSSAILLASGLFFLKRRVSRKR